MGLAVCIGATRAAEKEPTEDKDWAEARRKFEEFITPIVERARVQLKDPKIGWAEVRKDLVRKYLPDVRLYVRDGAFSGDTMIWVLTKDGQIADLGDGTWRGVGGDQYWAVEKVSEYLNGRKIKVENAQQAVEVAKLVEQIASSPGYVGMLRLNTKDYTVFDERFLKWMYAPRDQDWKYTAKPAGNGWEVKVEYAGPRAMVQQPPTYDMVLDEGKCFVDLRRVRR
jgi:hypothetical protein